MAATCYQIVRGKRIRVTRLDACGAPPAALAANGNVVSSGFITVAYAFDYEDGDEFIQKNANGDLCINDRSNDVFKRVMVTIDFCGVDPDLLSLVTGSSLVVDSVSGIDQGIDIDETTMGTSNFAFELWGGIDGQAPCPLTNETQSITEGGSGLTSFTLTYNGQTTASIAASSTVAQITTALQGLDDIDPGDISVTGPAGASNGPWLVTFIGRLAGTNVPQMTATPTGGTGTVTIATPVPGGVVTSGNYGYFLLPFLRNGTLRDFTVENGPTTFQVMAWTDGGGGWGSGPYNVVAEGAAGVPSAMKTPVAATTHMRIRPTTVPPPAAACGYQAQPATPTPAA